MSVRICMTVVLLSFQFVVHANGDSSSEQALEMLERMSSATRSLNYDGVFVYSRGDQLESMRIIHKVDEQGEKERLISLTGASREVVKDDQDVACFYSDNQTVMVDKGGSNKFLSVNFPESIARIRGFYNFQVLGKDRVAGRDTNIIELMPKDEHRYIYHFWVDEETGLMLKSAIVSLQEKPLETVLFTHIEIRREIPSDLMTPMDAESYEWHTNEQTLEQTTQDPSQWKVQWMPVGFSMESTNKQLFSGIKQPVEHLVYSDGLATVSLYIERVDASAKGKAMNGYVSMGAVNAYTHSQEDYQVTVVGELPAKTVHKIASSVVHNP
ncbi:MAG: MucB/RseB C-terminal domain-containing protein [Gammaproteobacteria bacterium]